jgi:hypothetical protein
MKQTKKTIRPANQIDTLPQLVPLLLTRITAILPIFRNRFHCPDGGRGVIIITSVRFNVGTAIWLTAVRFFFVPSSGHGDVCLKGVTPNRPVAVVRCKKQETPI